MPWQIKGRARRPDQAAFVVKNGSKIFFRVSSGIPDPVSATSMTASPEAEVEVRTVSACVSGLPNGIESQGIGDEVEK